MRGDAAGEMMIEVLVAAAAIATTAAPPTCSVCSSPNLCLQVNKTDSTDYSCVPRNNIDACDGQDGYNVSYCNEGTSLWGLLAAAAVVLFLVVVYWQTKTQFVISLAEEEGTDEQKQKAASQAACNYVMFFPFCIYCYCFDCLNLKECLSFPCFFWSYVEKKIRPKQQLKHILDNAPTSNVMYRNSIPMAQPLEDQPRLPPGWTLFRDQNGRPIYENGRPSYLNILTGEIRLERPSLTQESTANTVVPPSAPSQPPPLPPGWVEITDAKGRTYFYNYDTNESTWNRPTSLTQASKFKF